MGLGRTIVPTTTLQSFCLFCRLIRVREADWGLFAAASRRKDRCVDVDINS